VNLDIRTVADIVAAAGTLVIAITGVCALVYAAKQLRQAREAEKVKHLLEFRADFEAEPLVSYRKQVAEERLRKIPLSVGCTKILDFFETVSLLVRRGYLDIDDVWNTFSFWILYIYADLKEEIKKLQKQGDENYYKEFCGLVEKLCEIEKREGGEIDHPSIQAIEQFWRCELKAFSVPFRSSRDGAN
jgi:hypothetical protein